MKFPCYLQTLGIVSSAIGLLFIIGGVLEYFTNADFFGVRFYSTWFFLANSFIFLGIFFIVLYISYRHKKEE